ncbi:large ribosomal subunit protein P2-like [Neofelis nebulosa]|uniref:large ribosomal subunit protein P2-like n=1 Tax=Neofelis nebulosa TaxID=61452 RepID=UPI00272DB4D5|nr:large ribosomal subunit protein P2-like [Neofelis nebulosa]
MCYITSYLLASLRNNASPSAKYIKKILDSVGIKVDDDRLNKVICELNGKKNILKMSLPRGSVKLVVSMLTGGTVTVSAAPGSAAPADGSNTATAVEKRDDKKSKKWDVDMGSGLFH